MDALVTLQSGSKMKRGITTRPVVIYSKARRSPHEADKGRVVLGQYVEAVVGTEMDRDCQRHKMRGDEGRKLQMSSPTDSCRNMECQSESRNLSLLTAARTLLFGRSYVTTPAMKVVRSQHHVHHNIQILCDVYSAMLAGCAVEYHHQSSRRRLRNCRNHNNCEVQRSIPTVSVCYLLDSLLQSLYLISLIHVLLHSGPKSAHIRVQGTSNPYFHSREFAAAREGLK
jgi:hypothetical protein